ncbi:hypothetical protein CRUP_024220 [Coryphaenoides rupestris]|nr:hypothetical protein CRUP_024220 [Coryphaenoides rupestris]
MENCQLVHSESRGRDVQRDQKAMTGTERGGDRGGQAGRPGGALTAAEPSPAELAQCQVEMGTLLTSIAELNRKIGKLKAPSEPEDFKPSRVSNPLPPGLWPHRPLTGGQEKHMALAPELRSL